MSYRYLEELSSADAAFEASGKTPEEMFRDAAKATFEVMADLKKVKPSLKWDIELENESLDGLLIDWLSELVFLKDSESLIFCEFDVSISKNNKNNGYFLKAAAKGEKIDRTKHSLKSDVKAVTYHLFEVTKNGDDWTARVVLDI